jgi:hypothetical protein
MGFVPADCSQDKRKPPDNAEKEQEARQCHRWNPSPLAGVWMTEQEVPG